MIRQFRSRVELWKLILVLIVAARSIYSLMCAENKGSPPKYPLCNLLPFSSVLYFLYASLPQRIISNHICEYHRVCVRAVKPGLSLGLLTLLSLDKRQSPASH
ncbi:hypothetical protein B0H11DRAFT_2056601 [Mycena galericulata]|nr:hypothetical protein B0H11DRAFT_2056601 [Mycena galericulata]